MVQQTAVEWLLATLEQNSIIDLDWVDSDTYYTIINEAKQMEKEQAELRYKDGTPMRKYNSPKLQAIEMENKTMTAVQWLYNKMYEHRGNITIEEYEQAKKMEEEQMENLRPQIISNCIIKEISDEEIYKEAEKHFKGLALTRFVQGAKWYREQLKKR